MVFSQGDFVVHRSTLRIPANTPAITIGPETASLVEVTATLADGTVAPTLTLVFNVDFDADTTRNYIIRDRGDAEQPGPATFDADGDGVVDVADNCPDTPNADQADADADGLGDACDPTDDQDGDGVLDGNDNCPAVANADQADADADGIGDACDTPEDADGDGVLDINDNCPATANADQADADGDGLGDACDPINDRDEDGIEDDADNCPDIANADQSDADGDGTGDVCDATPDGPPGGGGGVEPPPPADCDGNGIPDEVELACTTAFHALGDLPGDPFSSMATAVSADGAAVVGVGNRFEPCGPGAQAEFVGECEITGEAFVGSAANGISGLGFLDGGASFANGTDGTGSVVVGVARPGVNLFFNSRAFRADADGMVSLGVLQKGDLASSASDVSDDGRVVVGFSSSPSASQAFRWTTGGMIGLGDLPGGSFFSAANAVSADGSVVAGWGTTADRSEPFRWIAATGMQGLGLLDPNG